NTLSKSTKKTSLLLSFPSSIIAVPTRDRSHSFSFMNLQTVYKGRKKKAIEYFSIKSVDKSQKNKVLQEFHVFLTNKDDFENEKEGIPPTRISIKMDEIR
ncbi:hypothetical protein RYX36_027575, partial [Vicia faba]